MKDAFDAVRYAGNKILIVFNTETGVNVVHPNHTKVTMLEKHCNANDNDAANS